MLRNKKIGFIGAGKMCDVLVRTLLSSNSCQKENIFVSDIIPERIKYFTQKYKINATMNNTELVNSCSIIILSVKPQQIENVLREIAIKKKKLVISIVAGITTGYIEKHFGRVPVVRVMPNISVGVNEGVIALCRGKFASKKDETITKELFRNSGMVIALQEKYMNAVTALSGSGPAYVYYLAEAMLSAGNKMSLSEEITNCLVRQTIYGAGKMLKTCLESPTKLRLMVTSQGGTTERAINFLDRKRTKSIITNAVLQAQKRAEELTR